MDREVRHADRVLVVGSPGYQQKVHGMEDGAKLTGVGWEAMLVTAALFGGQLGRDKLSLAVLRGSRKESLPSFLQTTPSFDLTNPDTFEDQYRELLRELADRKEGAPVLGELPADIEPAPVEPLTGTGARQPSVVDGLRSALEKFQRMYAQARHTAASGKLVEAFRLFQDAEPLQETYQWSDYYNDWADLAFRMGRYEQALDKYDRAAAKEGTNGHAHFGRAKVLEELGDRAGAIQALALANKAYAAFVGMHGEPVPGSQAWFDAPGFFHEWGLVLRNIGNYEDALNRFDRIMTMDDRFYGGNQERARGCRHEALVASSTTLRRLGRVTDAERACERARELDPEGTDAALSLDNRYLLRWQPEGGDPGKPCR
jgi:tetratricopeptide (TPR) repeat protein